VVNIYAETQFEDPEGYLPLSVRQMKHLKSWSRPIQVADPLKIMNGRLNVAEQINGFEVMQKQVHDCSVLSALAVAAHHEMKTNYQTRLISGNIYPQDKYGNPIYNPAGKYVVKMFVNGAWRAITIDDYFPRSKYESWTCAFSQAGKLWVNILEKAYLKLHGGYEFTGSCSSRDLYVLTGWLPEVVKIAKTPDVNGLWHKILQGTKTRDCLITLGTDVIPDE